MRLVQHILNHPPRQLMGRQAVQRQIIRRIDENLVDGIHMDVLRGDVLQIDLVNLGADLHVQGHPRHSDEEVQGQVRIGLDGRVVGGLGS